MTREEILNDILECTSYRVDNIKLQNLAEKIYSQYELLKTYKEANKKAIDKILCWGETLNPTFQKELLKILEGVEDE